MGRGIGAAVSLFCTYEPPSILQKDVLAFLGLVSPLKPKVDALVHLLGAGARSQFTPTHGSGTMITDKRRDFSMKLTRRDFARLSAATALSGALPLRAQAQTEGRKLRWCIVGLG